jgi:hypothetical protein
MTANQRRFHEKLRSLSATLVPHVTKELADRPVGFSVVVRLPVDWSTARSSAEGSVMVTKTPRGYEYVQLVYPSKRITAPRPRLLPGQRST